MGINGDLIQARFEDIRESVDRLTELRQLPRDDFLADQDALDIACYRLLVAIEAALQICFHVSAREHHQAPSSYAECFELLGKEGILSEELSNDLERMARFRNLLVHVYWEMDYELVYDVLQRRLGDLRSFVDAVGRLL